MMRLFILLFILFSFNWTVACGELACPERVERVEPVEGVEEAECRCKELEQRVHDLERSLFWLNQELSKNKGNSSWYSLDYPVDDKINDYKIGIIIK